MLTLVSSTKISADDQIADITTYQGATSLCAHARGFLDIAITAAKACLRHEASIDSITPAIIYCIRHATELFLKHVIAELSESHGEIRLLPVGHDMLAMFCARRKDIALALEYEAGHSCFDHRAWLTAFADVVTQLHQVDPDGQTLRYPVDKSGKPNLGARLSVSLAQLVRFAEQADRCFLAFVTRGT